MSHWGTDRVTLLTLSPLPQVMSGDSEGRAIDCGTSIEKNTYRFALENGDFSLYTLPESFPVY